MLILNPQNLTENIQTQVVDKIKTFFPIVGRKHTLRLNSIAIADPKSVDDIKSQAAAKAAGRTWASGIHGNFSLVDNVSGKVLDQQSKVRIAGLPNLTRRYSFIVDGSEYQTEHLWRLKSGVYSRIAATGEPEVAFNLKKGFNQSGFKMILDPDKKSFTFKYGSARVPLYPILNTLGVTDAEMEKTWGKEIFTATKAGSRDPKGDLTKLLTALKDPIPETPEGIVAGIRERFKGTELRPDTTILTLGKPFDTVSKDALLTASSNLLAVHRGEREPDNRDAIPFKDLFGVENLLADRIDRSRGRINRKLRNNLDRKSNVKEVFGADIFGVPIISFFRETSIANQTPQTNPVSMLSRYMGTTILGGDVGAMSTPFMVSSNAKMADPTQLGVVDPVHTPEGDRAGITLKLTTDAQRKGTEVYVPAYNTRKKKIELVTPTQLAHSVVSFPDQFFKDKDGKFTKSVTKKVTAQTPDDPKAVVDPKKVDFILPSPTSMFSPMTNLVPFIQNDDGTRVEMAVRHIEQALPLKHREEPLVQTHSKDPSQSTLTHERIWGAFAAHVATKGGTVSKVTKEAIHIKDKKGKSHAIQLYNNFPLNELQAFVTSTPIVKVGDKIQPGDPVADTNFTKEGILSLGVNLRVAYLPYKGLVFEDGLVISESAAKKLTSEHMFKPSAYVDRDYVLNKKRFSMLFPSALTAENREKLTEEGIIKVGEEVRTGDVLVATARKSAMTPEKAVLKGIHRSLVRDYSDKSVVWDKADSGTVVNVIRRGKLIEVHVRSDSPAQRGDKISGRHGNKGVLTTILPDDEMPRDKAGNAIDIVMNPLGVPGRMNTGQVYETALSKVALSEGSPVAVRNFQANADVRVIKVRGHWRAIKTGPKKKTTKHVWIEPYEYERDYREVVAGMLDERGLSEEEELYDDEGKFLGKRLVGHQYVLKLAHQAEKKAAARSWGPGYEYTVNAEPRGGGKHGAQRLGELGLYGLLAHGAVHNIREFASYKCFIGPTLVETDQGPLRIAQIVNGRMDVKVLSLTPTGTLEYRPIKNYWKRPLAGEALVTLKGYRKCATGPYIRHKTRCTPGHEYFTSPTKKVRADEMEQAGWALTPVTNLSPSQRSILVGSLFGDGYLGRGTHPYPWFQERHCIAQKDYLAFKAKVLGEYSRRELREYTTGCEGFSNGGTQVEWSTLGQPAFVKYHDLFYSSGARRFPQEAFELLDLLALATWFQDDGTTSTYESRNGRNGGCRIAAQAMLPEEYERAIARIRELTGARMRITKAGELSVYGAPAKKFLQAIAPYIHPSMAYKLKLIEDAPGTALTPAWWEAVPGTAGVGPAQVVSVSSFDEEDYDPKNHGESLYNLEVEGNHNYFANGLLVGNSDRTQDDIWSAVMLGQAIPKPKVPFAFEKFVAYLKVIGLDVEREGDTLVVLPFTDKDIKDLSNGELKDAAKLIRAKDLRPEPGGLFDEKITGGIGGKNFAHFKLAEPFPNPLFERPVKALLGITQKTYTGLIQGTLGVKRSGEIVPEEDADIVGPKGLKRLLGAIDVKSELKKTRKALDDSTGTKRNALNKRVKYLRALDRSGNKADIYMQNSVLVLPPQFRPLTVFDDGNLNRGDLNQLYKELSLSNATLKSMPPETPEEELQKLRLEVYSGLTALAGLLGPSREKLDKPKGILDIISGKTPKEGYFMRQLIKRKQDLSARGVIVPDQDLQLDEVGIPEKVAMELYRPFIIQRLVRGGMRPLQAKDLILNKRPEARVALESVLKERPVLMKRDPVLHKYGIMAFNAKLVGDNEIHIHPLVTSGYNADFDGDQVSLFVPVSTLAVNEAYKLLPSRNLLSPASGRALFSPAKESLVGLYLLSRVHKTSSKVFASKESLIKAAEEQKIPWDTSVKVGKKQTTAGREFLRAKLPEDIRGYIKDSKAWALSKKPASELMKTLALHHNKKYAQVAQTLKDMGFDHAHRLGFSFNLSNFKVLDDIRLKVLRKVEPKVAAVKKQKLSPAKRDAKIVELYSKATAEMQGDALKRLQKSDNPLWVMMQAGVKPGWSQIQQLILARMMVTDAAGKPIPAALTTGYGAGLSLHDYWVSAGGVRRGIISKTQEVQEPGAITKQVVKSTMGMTLTQPDCGTSKGLFVSVDNLTALDRYLAQPISVKGEVLRTGTAVTPSVIAKMKQAKVGKVLVRSPLKCRSSKGICQKCYGVSPSGNREDLGMNVGVIASQAIGEPATQLAMRVFHEGGTVSSSTSIVDGIERLRQVLEMPETLKGSAILAKSSGVVSKVAKSSVGGWDVSIGKSLHHVPASRRLHVVKGAKVSKGGSLSSGPVNPKELLELTNVSTVQNYLVKELAELYDPEGVRHKHLEVIVKALTDTAIVEDGGDNDNYLPGDVAPARAIEGWNAANPKKEQVEFKPVLKGVTLLPFSLYSDWITQLNYRNLRDVLKRAGSEGAISQLHGEHPIPGVAYGAEFGSKDGTTY